MWEPRRLTTLWAFTACYKDSVTFLASYNSAVSILFPEPQQIRERVGDNDRHSILYRRNCSECSQVVPVHLSCKSWFKRRSEVRRKVKVKGKVVPVLN
jgi:hypothetical protein